MGDMSYLAICGIGIIFVTLVMLSVVFGSMVWYEAKGRPDSRIASKITGRE